MTISATPAIGAQTAVKFSDLPLEIRIEIYKLAIPLSRVIRLQLTKYSATGNKSCKYVEDPKRHFESLSPPCIPTILHINRESRAIGLKIFKNTFGAPLSDRKDSKGEYAEKRGTYWNPKIDTLYLPHENPLPRHLARDADDLNYMHQTDLDDEEEYPPRELDEDVCKIGSDLYEEQELLQNVRHIALPVNYKTRLGFKSNL